MTACLKKEKVPAMNQHPTPKRFPTESIKKVGLILAGLFLAYTIIGFWIVPPIAKPRMEKALSRAIGREVTIERR